MPVLLVIDDEPSILHAFRRAFREPDVTLLTAGSATEGIQLAAQDRPDAVILDVELPDLSGLEALGRLRELDPKVPIIVITGHGTTETAIEATKLGAYDYLFKPLELDELRELVARAVEISRLTRVPPLMAEAGAAAVDSDVIIGRSGAMREVYLSIGRVAPQDETVLILGESGTGKELVARAIYHHSRRSGGPFRAVNCAAIPETLLESELFGHEKGAFTGADQMRVGKFEQASGGTLFLDEVGDMTPLTQAKMLRFLQERQFERVGGNETLQTDVRVIAATNCDLAQHVADCKFRPDLYYRLSVFTIRLPPLRERGDDLRLLTEHYVKRFGREFHKEVHEIHPEVHRRLGEYSWPGNIRELQSVIKQILLRSTGHVLLPDYLPSFLHRGLAASAAAAADGFPGDFWDRFIDEQIEAGTEDLYEEWQALTDRHLLSHVLEHVGGNLSQAARILGINRRTLRTRLRALGVDRP